MDPVTIGTTVVTLLTPYAADAGKELIKVVGDAGVQRARNLMQWLRDRLAGDPVASSDLSRFEEDPKTYAPGLQKTVQARAQDDPAFATEISGKLDALAPDIEVIQKYTNAMNLIGADVETVDAGSFRITQIGETAENSTGFKAKTVSIKN